jgi:hypothetical protein
MVARYGHLLHLQNHLIHGKVGALAEVLLNSTLDCGVLIANPAAADGARQQQRHRQ